MASPEAKPQAGLYCAQACSKVLICSNRGDPKYRLLKKKKALYTTGWTGHRAALQLVWEAGAALVKREFGEVVAGRTAAG